jgi:hypothetical protein
MTSDVSHLHRASPQALGELRLYGPQMLAHLDVTLSFHPALETNPLPIGPVARRQLHRELFEEILDVFARGDMARIIPWSVRTLAEQRTVGFTAEHWRIQLECWLTVIDIHLSPEAAQEIRPLFEWLSVNLADLADQAT